MSASICQHDDLLLDVSDFGVRNGFKRVLGGKLAAAGTEHNQAKKARLDGLKAGDPTRYPGPLVLPDDVLTWEEENDPQSFQDYLNEEDRNEVTPERKTIYLIAPPQVSKAVSFVMDWTKPVDSKTDRPESVSSKAITKGVFEYISAFYHGMPVKLYREPMSFVRHGSDKSKTPSKIDLAFNGLLLDIRTRACRDGVFPRQLNLNDLIDVLINLLPDDAYAIMMLVDHDIWEDDEDDYTCGRAYGGSRVGVVSTARYNPSLDAKDGWDTQHAWPASHCKAHTDQCIADFEARHEARPSKKAKKATSLKARSQKVGTAAGPLRLAVDVYRDQWSKINLTDDPANAARLWMSRVCKTASHELGHCIGMDHCTYYACMMQGTCGLEEDHRQPPYLCPIDLAKLLKTTGTSAEERDKALLKLLDKPAWKSEPMFAAYAAWIRSSVDTIQQVGDADDSVIILD